MNSGTIFDMGSTVMLFVFLCENFIIYTDLHFNRYSVKILFFSIAFTISDRNNILENKRRNVLIQTFRNEKSQIYNNKKKTFYLILQSTKIEKEMNN